MWTAADVSSQVAGYGPILVATAGLITALIAGATRRDKAQEGRSTQLDAKTDAALRGLEAYAERLEGEVARWTESATREQTRADAAETRIDELEEELRQLRRDPPAQSSRRQTGR